MGREASTFVERTVPLGSEVRYRLGVDEQGLGRLDGACLLGRVALLVASLELEHLRGGVRREEGGRRDAERHLHAAPDLHANYVAWGYKLPAGEDLERLIGRIDPRFDRRSGGLHLSAVHPEPREEPPSA